MRELLDFFKEIFMIKKETYTSIGLSQFKVREEIKKEKPKKQRKAELTMSELMRGAN